MYSDIKLLHEEFVNFSVIFNLRLNIKLKKGKVFSRRRLQSVNIGKIYLSRYFYRKTLLLILCEKPT